MKCNICGSNEAKIRPMELFTARYSLRSHVACNGHSQYRTVSQFEVEESLRLLDAAPEMLDLLKGIRRSIVACNQSYEGCAVYAHNEDIFALIAKIEGGGE